MVGILGGLFFIGLGLVNLLAPDFVWGMTRLGNSWNGQKSERSDLWELRRVGGGALLILVGIVVFAIGIAAASGANDDEPPTYNWTFATAAPTQLPDDRATPATPPPAAPAFATPHGSPAATR